MCVSITNSFKIYTVIKKKYPAASWYAFHLLSAEEHIGGGAGSASAPLGLLTFLCLPLFRTS